MADKLNATYLNRNPIVRSFFRLKTNLAVKIAGLKKSDRILDFGCGAGWLKNKLREEGYKVTGYDVTPEQSDVKDYTTVKPTKIFALDVFEHIPKEEIKKIIKNFKKMNPNMELIVAIPTENLFSRKIRKLLGKPERTAGHITSMKKILKILNSELKLYRKINLLAVSYIAKFRNF